MLNQPKVAIYCRLSEEDRNKQSEDDDSNSIQNQKSMLLQYSLEQGWDVYNIYSDDDYTGADRNRPAFNQLLKDAEEIELVSEEELYVPELDAIEEEGLQVEIEDGVYVVTGKALRRIMYSVNFE